MADGPVRVVVNDHLDLSTLRAVIGGAVDLTVDAGRRGAVDRAAAVIAEQTAGDAAVYGLNTGFGTLAQTRIPADALERLQRNLVVSHASGLGDLLDDAVVRLVLVLKARSLAQGHSGVRWEVIEALVALASHGVLPCVPAKGSVGASGDLAPLAHLTGVLLGLGQVRVAGEQMPAALGLRRAGLAPLVLQPKEGLAMLNGTQVSTALALTGLFAAENVFAAAITAGALTVEAMLGSHVPFDPRISHVRGQRGQIDVAAACLRLLKGSEINASHADCDKVQDPYSLRCQPQVMGAALDLMRQAAGVLEVEANAVTDNPLVFPDEGDVLSGGNFHAQPVAFAADTLALAIAEIGSLSERRIALLTDNHMSALPPMLAPEPGLNSGFMAPQVASAALASQNKVLAHPSSTDSLPTSANQEDHVSMATYAALRLGEMAGNTAGIVGIELLAAGQGIEFLRPRKSTAALEHALATVRAHVPAHDQDRLMGPDLAIAQSLAAGGRFAGFVPGLLPSRSAAADVPIANPLNDVVFTLTPAEVPVLVSLPHVGTELPDDIAAHMTETGTALVDTDWDVDRLYQFLRELGIGVIRAVQSRYVVDLNRNPEDQPLYPGAPNTGLVPPAAFDGTPLYRDGATPSTEEIGRRRQRYWQPYHDALAGELARMRERFGVAMLYDAHSIRSRVPRLFEGALPTFNIGSNAGQSADRSLVDRVAQVCQDATGYDTVVDGRFKGGYITRHYGRPADGVHAVQMELAQAAYMHEDPPARYDSERAGRLRPVLRSVMEAVVDWSLSRCR